MPVWMSFRSVPQTPQARTRTRTSSSPGTGTGRSCSSKRCGATRTVAFIVRGMCMRPPFAETLASIAALAAAGYTPATHSEVTRWSCSRRSTRRARCDGCSRGTSPDEVIPRLLDAAIRAPSGGGFQNWCFIVIRDAGMKAYLGKLFDGDIVAARAGRYRALEDALARGERSERLDEHAAFVRSMLHLAAHF